ncbi:hypothetical protein ACFWNT_19355 [Streptomyces sp. NPDC058409]|uniref:hypothetical protein n=1 Tax=Streptomyces sp. NPDC058409 TaxID=3346484 RepID=UPI00364D4DE3
MVEEWLSALSMSGATALVTAAATDSWQEVRAGFRRLFGRGDQNREHLAERRLDEVATMIEQADETAREEVREAQILAWRTRLADLLEERPDQAEELRTLIGRAEAVLPQVEGAGVTAMDTGSVATTNSGGINVANTGTMRDVNLHHEPRGLAE